MAEKAITKSFSVACRYRYKTKSFQHTKKWWKKRAHRGHRRFDKQILRFDDTELAKMKFHPVTGWDIV